MKRPNKKEIAQRNEAFRKAPKLRKRMIIARDVLAQLAIGKLKAKAGTYVTSSALEDDDVRYYSDDKQLQDVFLNASTCTACALGSMFVCGVQIANAITIGEVPSIRVMGRIMGESTYEYLLRFFDLNQLLLIESAFERKNMQREHFEFVPLNVMRNGTNKDYEIDGAIDFALDVHNDAERLRLIMENIIVNKGTFVPAQRPVQIWVTEGFKG